VYQNYFLRKFRIGYYYKAIERPVVIFRLEFYELKHALCFGLRVEGENLCVYPSRPIKGCFSVLYWRRRASNYFVVRLELSK
jgi:hypothetical protein